MNKKLAPLIIVALTVGFITSLALFFMKIGLIWQLKLFEIPIVLIMAIFLIASFIYKEGMREAFQYLEVQRFAAFAAITIALLSLMTKIF